MNALLMFVTALLFCLSYVAQNKMMTMQNAASSQIVPFLFGIMWSTITAAVWWISAFRSGDMNFDTTDIWFAVAGGITAGLCNLFYVLSLYHGPLSLSAIFIGIGPVLPVVLAMVFLSEIPTTIQFVALALTIAVIVIVNLGPVDKKPTKKWFILALLAFACYGAQLYVFKMHYAYIENPNNNIFMGILYVACALTFAVGFFIMKAKTAGDEEEAKVLKNLNYKVILIFAIIQSATNGIANAIYLPLSENVPAVVLYPTVETGSLLMTSIVSYVYFKEKMTKSGLTALILGLVAVALLNM